MKLKLQARNTETIRTTLSLVSLLRKFVVLRFTPEKLIVILVHPTAMVPEPQAWCKLNVKSVFDSIEIQSLHENVILLEVNIDLFLQTLRNYDKASSDILNIRLQKKDSNGEEGSSGSSGRNASLALFYTNTSVGMRPVNHTFKIPVKILKSAGQEYVEPQILDVDLMLKLPQHFSGAFRRLDKFDSNQLVKIQAQGKDGGSIRFIVDQENKIKVIIRWNSKLEIYNPADIGEGESLRLTIDHSQLGQNEEHDILVHIKDLTMASKIVSTCQNVIFLMSLNRACVVHGLLKDSDDVEVVYYIMAARYDDD